MKFKLNWKFEFGIKKKIIEKKKKGKKRKQKTPYWARFPSLGPSRLNPFRAHAYQLADDWDPSTIVSWALLIFFNNLPQLASGPVQRILLTGCRNPRCSSWEGLIRWCRNPRTVSLYRAPI
jgi:hypothetical protein